MPCWPGSDEATVGTGEPRFLRASAGRTADQARCAPRRGRQQSRRTSPGADRPRPSGSACLVTKELDQLAMARAVVQVRVAQREADRVGPGRGADRRSAGSSAGPDGIDQVDIVMIAHPGAPELPIAKGASGGELSRVMLALEVVLADADPVATLVFDEVDAGVGGRAASEIGSRLAALARSHQVIVVTHLAQVAAYADRHFVVDASTGGRVGTSDVRLVAGARSGGRAGPDARRNRRRDRPGARQGPDRYRHRPGQIAQPRRRRETPRRQRPLPGDAARS